MSAGIFFYKVGQTLLSLTEEKTYMRSNKRYRRRTATFRHISISQESTWNSISPHFFIKNHTLRGAHPGLVNNIQCTSSLFYIRCICFSKSQMSACLTEFLEKYINIHNTKEERVFFFSDFFLNLYRKFAKKSTDIIYLITQNGIILMRWHRIK